MGRKKGAQYTREEAETLAPQVLKQVALQAVDLMIALDKRGLYSGEVEARFWALRGETGHLSKMLHTCWREKALEEYHAKHSAQTPASQK